jgi:hypothetical protein
MKAASVDVAAMIGIGLTDAATRTRQVRELADGIVELAAASAANKVVEQQITPETRRAPRLWGIARQTRSIAWVIRHRPLLGQALN